LSKNAQNDALCDGCERLAVNDNTVPTAAAA
jgi:hypothetical protein